MGSAFALRGSELAAEARGGIALVEAFDVDVGGVAADNDDVDSVGRGIGGGLDKRGVVGGPELVAKEAASVDDVVTIFESSLCGVAVGLYLLLGREGGEKRPRVGVTAQKMMLERRSREVQERTSIFTPVGPRVNWQPRGLSTRNCGG